MIRPTTAAVLLAVIRTAVAAADPERFTWHVVSVEDGDTLTCVDSMGGKHKLRLQGIDAPQLDQPFGQKARVDLALLTSNRMVDVEISGRDGTGRVFARVLFGRKDVNVRMVAAGLAWRVSQGDGDDPLAAAGRDARAAGRGLWTDPEPVPPWAWRAAERERGAPRREPAGR